MRHKGRAPEMNVTPLVDVVLVLLIIFMVVIPQLNSGAAITMQPAENIDPKSDVEYEPLTVGITKTGDVFFDKKPVDKDRLFAVLTAAHDASPDRRIQIRGDREVPYEAVRSVFRDCQEIGFPGVGLAVGEKDPDEEK